MAAPTGLSPQGISRAARCHGLKGINLMNSKISTAIAAILSGASFGASAAAPAAESGASPEALGEIIRAHPEQYMWSHRRFRHSPDLPGDPY